MLDVSTALIALNIPFFIVKYFKYRFIAIYWNLLLMMMVTSLFVLTE